LPKKIHKKARRLRTIEEIEELFPGFKAFLDATEQEIPRPKNKRKRKTHYSGRKKRHTVKTQITVNKDGLIVHKTRHAQGRKHDYSLFKWCHPNLPDNVRLGLDLGYDGVQNDYPELGAHDQQTEKVQDYGAQVQKPPQTLRHHDIVCGLTNFRMMGTAAI